MTSFFPTGAFGKVAVLVKPEVDYPQPDRRPRVVRYTWRLTPESYADAAECGELDGKAVQVTGTFGAATVVIQGGLVRDALVAVRNGHGVVTFTEPDVAALPDVVYVQPVLLDATPETAVTVVLTGRRP